LIQERTAGQAADALVRDPGAPARQPRRDEQWSGEQRAERGAHQSGREGEIPDHFVVAQLERTESHERQRRHKEKVGGDVPRAVEGGQRFATLLYAASASVSRILVMPRERTQ